MEIKEKFESVITSVSKRLEIKILLVGVLAYIFAFAFTTGDMNIFAPDNMGFTFVNMWDNLKAGRYDVERWALGIEAYTRDGKTYSYFGPFPALFRGVIELFFHRGTTDWSKISTILATLIAVFSFTLSYYKVALKTINSILFQSFFTFLFGVTIAFGSPITILLSSAGIYHESIMWGLAWTGIFIYNLISFIFCKEINLKTILMLSISAGAAFLTRVTYGGCLLTIFGLVISLIALSHYPPKEIKFTQILNQLNWSKEILPRNQLKKILIIGIMPCLICTMYMLKTNHERWGNSFTFLEPKYYDEFYRNLDRGRKFREAGVFNISRIPHAFSFYFIPTKENFSDQFPYITISSENFLSRKFKPAVFDSIDPVNSLPVNSPYLFLLGVIGIFCLISVFGGIGAILFSPLLILNIAYLSFYSITLRYITEFLPFLAICAMASTSLISKLIKNNKVAIVTCLISLLVAIAGVYSAISTVLQVKLIYWYYGISEDVRSKTKAFIYSIDRNIKSSYTYKWNNLKSEPLVPFTIESSRTDGCCPISNLLDGNLDSIWTAGGSAPATLSIKYSTPAEIESLWLLARQPHNFIECWKRVTTEFYLDNKIVSKQTFLIKSAHKSRIQGLKFKTILSDKVNLTFSDPVTITPQGNPVDPSILNPGYNEILIRWKNPGRNF